MQLTPDRLKTLLVLTTSVIAIGGLNTTSALAVPATAPTEQQDDNSEGSSSQNSCFAEAAAYELAATEADYASRQYRDAAVRASTALSTWARTRTSYDSSRRQIRESREAYYAANAAESVALTRWVDAAAAEASAQAAYYRCMGWS